MTDANVESDKQPEAQGHGDGQGEDSQPMQLDRPTKEYNDEGPICVQQGRSIKDDVQDRPKQRIPRMKAHQEEHSPKCDRKTAVKGKATSPKRDLKRSASGGGRRALRRASISAPRSANSSPNSRFVEKTASGTGGGRVKRRSSLGGVAALPGQGMESSTFQCPVTASAIRKPSVTEITTETKPKLSGPLFAPAKFLLENDDDTKQSFGTEDLEQMGDEQYMVEPKSNELYPSFELKDGRELVANAEFQQKEEKDIAILEAAAEGDSCGRLGENNPRGANGCYSNAQVAVEQDLAQEGPNVFDANFEMAFVENDYASGHIGENQGGIEEKRKRKQQKNMDRSQNRLDSLRRSRSSRNHHQKEDNFLTTTESTEASDRSECSDDCQEIGRLDALLQFDFNAPEGKHFASCNIDDTSIFRMNSIRTLTAPDCTTIRLNDFDKQLLDIKTSDHDNSKKKGKKGFKLAPSKLFRKSRKNKNDRCDPLDEMPELETNGDEDNEEGGSDNDGMVKIGADASETNGMEEKRNFEKKRIRRIRDRDRAKHRNHDGGIDRSKSKDSDSDWARNSSTARTKRDSDRIGNHSGRMRDRTTAKECERVRYDKNKQVAKNTETSRGVLLNRNAQNAHRKERKDVDTEWTRNSNKMKELYGVSTLIGGENDAVMDDNGTKDVGSENTEKNDCRDRGGSCERERDSETVENSLEGGEGDSAEKRGNGNEVCENLQPESDGINSEETGDESRPEGCGKEESNAKGDKEKWETINTRRARDRAALKKAASTRVVPTRTKSNDSGLKAMPSISHVISIRRRTHQTGSIPTVDIDNPGWARNKSFSGDDSDVASPVTTSTRKQLLSVRKAQTVLQLPAFTKNGEAALNRLGQRRRRCGTRDGGDLDRNMDRSIDRSREHSDMDKSGSNRRRRYSRRNGDMGDSSEGGRGMDRSENYSDMDKSGSGRKKNHTRRCCEMDDVQEERGESPVRGVRGSQSMRAERSKVELSFPEDLKSSKSNLHETCHNGAYDDKATSKVQKKSLMKKTLDKSSAIGKGAKKFIKGGARNIEKRTLLIDDEDYSSE